jgi:hypothetical protein
MADQMKQLLAIVIDHASPKLMVGILGALLFECEELTMSTYFLTESTRVCKIHWHEAIVFFGESLDMWLQVKYQLASHRRQLSTVSVPILVPFGYPSLANGAFPWSVRNPIVTNPHLVPITFGSYFYRHRTMEQVHKISHVLLSIPYRLFGKGCVLSPSSLLDTGNTSGSSGSSGSSGHDCVDFLYDKDAGIHSKFRVRPVTLSICSLNRVVESKRARLEEARMYTVGDETVRMMSASSTLLAQDVCWAALNASDTVVQVLDM